MRLGGSNPNYNNDFYVMYLQLLANAHFDFVKKSLSSQNTARNILVEENEMWLEHLGNVGCRSTDYRYISSAVVSHDFNVSVCSPDKRLLVVVGYRAVTVFELPSLTMIFKTQVSQSSLSTPTFSPDSSYFVCGSIRFCVCIRKQKEVAFIPGGPEDIKHCSFSSCGKKLVTTEKDFLKVWNVEKRELLVQVEKHLDPLDRYHFSGCDKYILNSNPLKLVVRDSATLKKVLTLHQVCSEKRPDSNQVMFSVRERIRVTTHYHLSADEVVEITHAETFTWRNRGCQILSCSSTLIVYDFINREVIDRFEIDCLPADTKICCISKLDGTNFLLSLDKRHIVVLSLETPKESSVVSYAFPDTSFQVTLSPDHLYVACCYYEYNVLTIRSVVNGGTLETVELQKASEACCWSELYLWVVCEGALVRFPYYPTHSKVLGSGREVCPLTFGRVFKFGEGVFVFKGRHMVHILKICDNMPFIQKIGDPPFSDAAISKDGCAVLLYHIEDNSTCLLCRLWEFTPEMVWELHLYETIGTKFRKLMLKLMSLTGTQNCRRSMTVGFDMASANSTLSFYDFSSKELYEYHISQVKSCMNCHTKRLVMSGYLMSRLIFYS